MIKKIIRKQLDKAGKTYPIDPDIPDRLFYRAILLRITMLIRGFLRTGKKVYLGPNCTLINRRNISFGRNVTIEKHTRLDGFSKKRIVLSDGVKIGAYSNLLSTSHFSRYGIGLTMGENSAVGDFTHFGAPGGITIGKDVIMGSYVSFHAENHNFGDTSTPIRLQGTTSKGIVIGDDVWVGAKVTFLDGCSVGNHCVVAAGAVVTGQFPDHSVIGGVPARILKTTH